MTSSTSSLPPIGTPDDGIHAAQVLLASVTGALLVLDIAAIEVGDLVFFSGHLIRRVATTPRDHRLRINGSDRFEFEVARLDTGSRGRFSVEVGTSLLVLRPTA